MKTLGMARMFALHFLQEHDVGVQFAQAIASSCNTTRRLKWEKPL
jgi:hypothetical protein